MDHYLVGAIASSLHPWFAQFGREIAIKGAQLFPVSNYLHQVIALEMLTVPYNLSA